MVREKKAVWNMKTLVVRPKTINDVLVNPGMGFTTFQRFNGDALNEGRIWTEGFPLAGWKTAGWHRVTNRSGLLSG